MCSVYSPSIDQDCPFSQSSQSSQSSKSSIMASMLDSPKHKKITSDLMNLGCDGCAAYLIGKNIVLKKKHIALKVYIEQVKDHDENGNILKCVKRHISGGIGNGESTSICSITFDEVGRSTVKELNIRTGKWKSLEPKCKKSTGSSSCKSGMYEGLLFAGGAYMSDGIPGTNIMKGHTFLATGSNQGHFDEFGVDFGPGNTCNVTVGLKNGGYSFGTVPTRSHDYHLKTFK